MCIQLLGREVPNLKINEISKIIESDQGYHIISVNKKIISKSISYQDIKPKLIKEHKKEIGTRKYFDLIDQISERNFTKQASLQNIVDEFNLPGDNLNNVFPAMEFLTASNRKGLGDKIEKFDNGTLNAENKHVVVIGGGDTAMDCVRTAVRQNAKSVKCLYRRDKKNMPGSTREVSNAEEEGVEFIWQSNPKKFIGKEKISSVLVEKMKLGESDSSGRKRPEPIKDSDFEIKADILIKALGFDPENLPKLFNDQNLLVSKWGTIKINYQTMETNTPGIFSAGDIVRGASLVVWAIKDGREAAVSIDKYLELKRQKKIKAA